MKITIKKLQGEELTLEVDDKFTILDVKKYILSQLKIPVCRQKLIFQGKVLLDENNIGDYKLLKDGSKINLMVKDPESIQEALKKLIAKYLTPEQAEKYAKEISLDLEKKMDNMSLDDIRMVVEYYKAQGA